MGLNRHRVLGFFVVAVLVVGLVGVRLRGNNPKSHRVTAVATTTTTSTTSTTITTTTTTTTTEPPSTEPPPPPASAPPPPVEAVPDTAPPPPPPAPALSAPQSTLGTWTTDPYLGLGTWIDVYDWTAALGGSQIAISDIDRMADLGVQTLYVQPVRWDSANDLTETDRLVPLLERARAKGMRVVAWYLPNLEDVGSDLRHIHAIAQYLPIDGLAIDIESRAVDDVDVRNQRLLGLSDQLRADYPGQVLGGIVLPPVVMEDVNPGYWPGYPWAGLAPDYDVWLPMSYATNRIDGWRDARLYTAENIARVRQHLGQPEALVHTIGGIGNETTVDDVRGMVNACQAQGCTGGSLYDYRTTTDPALWSALQPFRF